MSRNDYGPDPVGGYGNPGNMRAKAIASVSTPIDRVRWPAVFAGIFSAISLLVVLFVLGSAIGLSAYNPGDNSHNYMLGAGWWAAISALIAFAFGGWVAAKTSAASGGPNGFINGAMVWAVAIPALLVLAGGVASLAGGAAAGTAGRQDISAQSQNPGQGGSISDQARQAGAQLQGQMTPSDTASATSTGAKAAWGTLASLVLGFLAAAFGGYAGARRQDVDVIRTGPATT